MAKNIEKFEHMKREKLEEIAAKKFAARDKKISKPKMTVTGKGVFNLQRLIVKKKKA